jgi:hypothetical protein
MVGCGFTYDILWNPVVTKHKTEVYALMTEVLEERQRRLRGRPKVNVQGREVHGAVETATVAVNGVCMCKCNLEVKLDKYPKVFHRSTHA